MPSALRGDVGAVHQTRVATRRLRESLPVVAKGATRRKLGKSARRMTRALGPVRELDVTLATLDELRADRTLPRDAIARLRALMAQERRSLQQHMRERLRSTSLEKRRDRAAAAARKALSREGATGRERPWLVRSAERCARRAVRLRAAIERAAGLYLPDRLHAVRIALKKLRYALELASDLSSSPSGPRSRRAAARVRTLRQTQDVLGRMHDFEVLVARTRALQGSSAIPDLRLSGDLDVVVRRLENECRQLHARYMAVRPALISVCDDIEASSSGAVRRSAA